METLVIYFSQKGKTKEAAGRIAQLSGADLAEIKTHKSYRMSYRKTVFTSLKEILLNERPELDMEIPDISAYDRILIGSPIWCGTFPNAVFSFLDKINLNAPYIGFTEDEVRDICDRYGRDFSQVERWYDGYMLGDCHVYNPRKHQHRDCRPPRLLWRGNAAQRAADPGGGQDPADHPVGNADLPRERAENY